MQCWPSKQEMLLLSQFLHKAPVWQLLSCFPKLRVSLSRKEIRNSQNCPVLSIRVCQESLQSPWRTTKPHWRLCLTGLVHYVGRTQSQQRQERANRAEGIQPALVLLKHGMEV